MSTTRNHEADILSRLEAPLSPEGARDLLKLDCSLLDQRRMEELLEKGNRGTRTREEEEEAMEFERLGHVFSMLKSIAHETLNRVSQ